MRVSWGLIERFLRLDKEWKRWSRLTRVISGTASLSLGNLQGHVYFFEEKKKKEEKKIAVTRTYYMKGNVYVGTGNAQGKVLALRSRMWMQVFEEKKIDFSWDKTRSKSKQLIISN